MELPKPEDVRNLMGSVSHRVQTIVEEVVKLAMEYGIHGRSLVSGQYSFQVTRISEIWFVYVKAYDGDPKEITRARLDEKIIFLEHSDEFVKEYRERIISVYDQLRKLAEKK